MSTGAIIAIVIAAIVVIALVVMVSQRQRVRRLEQRRGEAADLRDEARLRGTRAERHQAAADEQAAGARRQAAEAEERAMRAKQERAVAEEHAERAREVDPDAPDDEEARTDQREPNRA
jgi:biopolymer transport protein ExbB/TolQ